MEGLLVSALSLPNKFLLAFHSHSFFLLLSRYLAPTCSTSRSIGLFRAHSFLFGISVPSRYPTPCSLFHLLPHFSSTLSVSISIYLSLVPSLFSSLCPRFLVSLRHSEHLPPPSFLDFYLPLLRAYVPPPPYSSAFGSLFTADTTIVVASLSLHAT